MYEALALGLWGADGTDSVLEEITDEQLERIGSIVSDRLALLKAPARAPAPPPAIDTTRGGVVNALYRQAAVWDFPEVEADADAVDCLVEMGVLLGRGRHGTWRWRAPARFREALVMAQRLVLHLYDRRGAPRAFSGGPRGNGNTLIFWAPSTWTGTISIPSPGGCGRSSPVRTTPSSRWTLETRRTRRHSWPCRITPRGSPAGPCERCALPGGGGRGAALPQPYTMDEAAVDRYEPWAYANLVNSVTLLMGEDSLEGPSGGGYLPYIIKRSAAA